MMISELEENAPESLASERAHKGREKRSSATIVYLRLGKRFFDTVASAIGLLVTSPLFFICAVAVRLDSPGPIFFRQRRVGQCGRPFDIIKFRTMVHQAEKKGPEITADGDSRITATGKWLRKLKLDELPQLFNVLKGDMSLVGPRPEVPRYVAAYNADQLRVLELKPGITGPAALAYIDEEKLLAGQPDPETFYVTTLMPQKLELDLQYCKSVSFVGDVYVVFATLANLLHSGRSRRRQPEVAADHERGGHKPRVPIGAREVLPGRPALRSRQPLIEEGD